MEEITLSMKQLTEIITRAAMIGAKQFADIAGIKTNDSISQSQAFKIGGGRSNIERLEAKGLITSVQYGTAKNSKVIYSRTQIETALKIKL